MGENEKSIGDRLAERLVEVIESRANEIAKVWYRDAKESIYLPSIKKIPEDQALKIATTVYKKLSYWLLPSSEKEIRRIYERFGAAMYRRGFRMEEVVMILVLVKRYLWLHLLEEGLMTTSLDLYQALDLNNKVVLYFDRAIYFSLVGYKEARSKSIEAAYT